MGFFAYIIAALMALFGSSTQTFNQGVDKFLDDAAGINWILLWVSVGIWVVFGLLPLILSRKKLVSGFFGFVLLFLPLAQLFIWFLNTVMANSFGPDGVTNAVAFYSAAFFTIWVGIA